MFEILNKLESKPSLSAHFESYETLLEKIKLTCQEDAVDLAWEEDTDDEMENEEVLKFRQDLGDNATLDTKSAIKIVDIDTAVTTLANPVKADDNIDMISEPQSTHELEDSFHKELTNATIKADFDERYIQSSFERRRLGLPLDSATSTWKQSIQANPLTALENISRSVLLEKRVLSEEFKVGTIKELEDDCVEISEASKKYADFLPLDAPILNLIGFDL